MANINTVTGAPQIIANMRQHTRRMGQGVERGLKVAGLTLQRESQRLVPVEFGPLKASAFTRAVGNGFRTVVSVGYTASYALYVHEKVGMILKGQKRVPSPPHRGKYWDPQGRAQAKFLEAPVRRFQSDLNSIVKAEILRSTTKP